MLLENFYSGKKIFLTGHTGFKGTWMSLWLNKLGAKVVGYSLEADEESLFNLVWVGAGRWDWETLYTMPIHIRRFWISKLNKMQDEALSAANNRKSKSNTKPKVVKSPL